MFVYFSQLLANILAIKYSNFVIIIVYNLVYGILNKSCRYLFYVNISNSSVIIVLVGFMLLLSMYLTVQSQVAEARKQSKGDAPPKEQQLVNQKIKCTSDAICLAKAINILCMKNSLCYIGYNAPFLMSTPH